MSSKSSRREALKIAGLTAATGALGFATLQSSPVHAYTAELSLHNERFAKLLEEEAANALPAKVPDLPAHAISAKSSSDDITALQTRLNWAGLSDEKPTGTWTEDTTAGVSKLQWKTASKRTGVADADTVASLTKIATTDKLDNNCYTAKTVLCVDKTQKIVRFVQDKKVIKTFHVNIGPEKGDKNFKKYSATREGKFKIGDKQVNSVSSLYGYSMPYWMQFDQGIGFHFSKYFSQTAYSDASMGCVILGNKQEAKWLYDNTDTKTARVVVYSS